jgi:sortase A
MRKHLSTIILVIVLIVGVMILLYPTVSDYWNSFHQSRAIASYLEQI